MSDFVDKTNDSPDNNFLNKLYKQTNGVFVDKIGFDNNSKNNLKQLTKISQNDALNFSAKTKRRSLLNWKTFISSAAAIIIVFISVIITLTANSPDNSNQINASEPIANTNNNQLLDLTNSKLFIDIQGEINKPGVYELDVGSRVSDVIKLADGLKKSADASTINQARKLTDGEQIYIPKINTSQTDNSNLNQNPNNQTLSNSVSGININTATITELDTLNGIGPAIAQRIIDYRTQNGSFSNIDEIKNVKGIGDAIFDKIKDQIRI
ncbi:MAG: helix-hairpin-helix domain-containing protein [Bifidobacteriaceae bacterium]|jgi:competence protein ComEA|nr:helix-hairpin-helix domain-containing protein [Bifidobacteriaceae bacterium]